MRKILKWLDNFWYHYRWIVLIAAFFIVSGAIMIVQFADKDNYDAMILYTGPDVPSANETLDIQDAFESVMSNDYDGDGKRIASLDALFLLTDEQLEDTQYTTDADGNTIYINTSDMVTTRQQFTTQIFVGEALICLLDPNWYELVHEKNAFVPLAELTDQALTGEYDECALYLKDTAFGEYFSAFDVFPDDTLICFRRMSSASGLKSEEKEKKRYEYNRQLFINILNFSI